MTTAELKLEIVRKMDLLESSQLNKLSSFVENMVHENIDLEEWNKLTAAQRKGILAGLDDIEKNGGTNHEVVMKRLRNKMSHA
jgi:predicted transcriptional regulator